MPDTRTRVLFADDHIPSDDIDSADVEARARAFVDQTFANQDASFRDEATRGFPSLRAAVESLRGDGFDVTIANTYARALRLAKSEPFDIAIVDLGWVMDVTVPAGKRMAAGWDISAEIDKRDTRTGHVTRQIIYSSRLVEDARIIDSAAARQKMPVLKYIANDKSPMEVAIDGLRAAVKFQEAELRLDPSDIARRIGRYEDQTLNYLSRWSTIAQVLVLIAVLVIIVGAVLAFSGVVDVGTVTAASGALVSLISGMLFVQLREARRDARDSRDRLYKELHRQNPSP